MEGAQDERHRGEEQAEAVVAVLEAVGAAGEEAGGIRGKS